MDLKIPGLRFVKSGDFLGDEVNVISGASGRAQQHRLELSALQGGGDCVGDQGEVGHQRGGLAIGVILAKGNEVDVFLVQQGSDGLGRGGQAVVGGYGDDYRPAGAQVGHGGHGHGGVGDAGGQLAQGVARAGADDQGVQQGLGADGLGLVHRVDDAVAGDRLDPLPEGLGGAEAGVPTGRGVGEDAGDVAEAGLDGLQGLQGPGVGAEGAAKGEADVPVVHIKYPPQSGCDRWRPGRCARR